MYDFLKLSVKSDYVAWFWLLHRLVLLENLLNCFKIEWNWIISMSCLGIWDRFLFHFVFSLMEWRVRWMSLVNAITNINVPISNETPNPAVLKRYIDPLYCKSNEITKLIKFPESNGNLRIWNNLINLYTPMDYTCLTKMGAAIQMQRFSHRR